MSTITETLVQQPARRFGGALFSDVRRVWKRLVAHRAELATYRQLSRKDPRLLRDMGFDPASVRAAVRGGWDEVEPGMFHLD